MNSISVNHFRDNLRKYVEDVALNHEPLKVTRRKGEDFVVISAEDWERQEETVFVLQNSSLMKQIFASLKTHETNQGYTPTPEELHEINSV